MEYLMNITKILALGGALFSLVIYIYYTILSIKLEDAFYFRLSLIYPLICTTMLATFFLTGATNSLIYPVLILISYLWFFYELTFGEKRLEESDKKYEALCNLERCGINYKKFKKLSRKEQVMMLQTAIITWEDGTTDILVEDEEELQEYECILNKQ